MKHDGVFLLRKTGVSTQHAASDSKSLLATLRTDAPLFKKVETLRWRGAMPDFAAWTEKMKAPRLLERCQRAAARIAESRI